MKKVEEVVETKEMVKLEVLDMMRSGAEKFHDNLHERMSKDSNRVGLGLAIAVYFIIPVVFKNIDER